MVGNWTRSASPGSPPCWRWSSSRSHVSGRYSGSTAERTDICGYRLSTAGTPCPRSPRVEGRWGPRCNTRCGQARPEGPPVAAALTAVNVATFAVVLALPVWHADLPCCAVDPDLLNAALASLGVFPILTGFGAVLMSSDRTLASVGSPVAKGPQLHSPRVASAHRPSGQVAPRARPA